MSAVIFAIIFAIIFIILYYELTHTDNSDKNCDLYAKPYCFNGPPRCVNGHWVCPPNLPDDK